VKLSGYASNNVMKGSFGALTLLAVSITPAVAGAIPTHGECHDACIDLDYAQRVLETTCPREANDAKRTSCLARLSEVERENSELETVCGCRRVLAELHRERHASVGIAMSLPFGPRVIGEVNAFEGRWSVAAFVGVGRLGTHDPASHAATDSIWSYEVGAQLRAYVVGTFTQWGVVVGLESLYRRAQVEDDRLDRAQGIPGLHVGPFVAVRLPGFPILHTVELDLGLGYVVWDRSAGGSRFAPHGSIGFNWLF
jgi:hypothetical protein